MQRHSFVLVSIVLSVAIAWAWMTQASHAYVEAPMSLGAIVQQSSTIVLMRVESVDKTKNIIIYRKVRDIKGKHAQEFIKHNIGRGGLRANEWKPQMDWAEPGKTAVFFYNGGASETCIGGWWYQAYGGGEWWNHSHAEPFLLRSFCGNPEKLASIVDQMLQGQETMAPCMVDGNKEDLHNCRAKIQRLKVSLKIQDYNPKRDFLGWGGEDFRRLLGMPGFTHISPVGRVDPEAQAISVVDFDGDGKQDLCLIGGKKVVLLQNNGDSMSETMLTGVSGARSAVWADFNGDGKADLLLATPTGLRLFTNLGKTMRDDSHLLPPMPGGAITAAAWLDHDGDGKPDLLVAHGYHGLRLYRNVGAKAPADPKGKFPPAFEDVSSKVGLGEKGIGADLKGDSLTVCDVNGDGRPDFLYGAGKGILVLSSKNEKGDAVFIEAKDSGIAFAPGKINPIFGDFDGDGHPDLLIPQKTGVLLFKNDGKGKFTDATEKAGLAKSKYWATSAAIGDIDNDGHLDLVIGCLKGSNRYFRNKGDGTFEDASEAIGLTQKIFNTQAVSLVDLKNRGVLDMIFNNEGQDSVVLLANPEVAGKRVPLTLQVASNTGIIGSRVDLHDKDGKRLATRQICGGEGRGGQQAPLARFTLTPGQYRVNVRLSSGTVLTKNITLGDSPMRSRIDEGEKAAGAE
ncbi:MAG: VCBS repeat-containing protein [Planctomycetes bacterium]|nr:VCBS repeat-containing protein [Planctomycetota bacterium]